MDFTLLVEIPKIIFMPIYAMLIMLGISITGFILLEVITHFVLYKGVE